MSNPIVRSRTDRDSLVRAWMRVIAATAYVPRSSADVREVLTGMVDTIMDALDTAPFDSAAGLEVGTRMVAEEFTGEDTLRRSVATLATRLIAGGAPAERVIELLAAVSSGYANAWRERTLSQQENMRLALHTAMLRAERDRKNTESIFREVFASASVGIAITDQDGRFVETNPALAEILACEPAALAGRALADFVTDEPDVPGSPLAHLPDRQRLLRANGEAAWVFATSSVLSDDAGKAYRVTMVQDLSELHLLGDRLTHQLLHDALTGLVNRVGFESRLEAVHGRVEPTGTLTLCCLDLDAFAMVNTTYGHPVGDWVLRTVAERLKAVVAAENAVVARLGGDEFAVLIQDGPDTPSVPDLVEAIQAELAEPEYRDGIGLAVSATIGVIRTSPGEMSAAEVFRAADAALRQARLTGRRQWAQFDPDADKRDRKAGKAATELPAAWENGELDVAYDRVVRLSDRVPVRVAAIAHLPRPRPVPGLPSTIELAESTGLSVALGPWLISRSTAQVPVWRSLFAAVAGDGPVQRVLLSPLQSADAELSAVLNRAVTDAGVPPGLLEVGLAASTVLTSADAQDNLRTLSDIGVVTALHGFAGGPRELAMIERFKVDTVLLADPFDGWRPDWLPRDCAQVRAVREVIAAVGAAGAAVGIRSVRDFAEARWWADLGVVTGEGPAFGTALDIEDVLRAAK
ncbi:diguanylate cyclase domain-containing protein [Alloactinosynnema sp. L-07]|uniref:diguanylate cyclase domain-containing protein n=1 Tax=Alloactinosynnema sp. L-07 TaxID=1653480 RepID=UPI0006B5C0E9|nr:diguanylate cyclase [Alloactinosynnema sp. L-07]